MRYNNQKNIPEPIRSIFRCHPERNEGSLFRFSCLKFFAPLRMTRRLFSREGMSLIETLVYVAILGMISVFIVNSLIKIVAVYRRAQAEREVLSNARLMMETVTKNIAYSQEVYAPTSRFNTTNGQISLVTPLDTLPEHTTTYLDFWSDGNRLLMREEGKATTTLSAATVQVAQFRVERIVQGLGREAIKITLNVV